MAEPNTQKQRDFLALSFEPAGDGWLFYENARSAGVPVSAAERDAYLDIPLKASRKAWMAEIAYRAATGPRRPYLQLQARLWASFPAVMAVGLIAVGAVFLAIAAGGGQAIAPFWIGGALFTAYGLGIFIAKAAVRRKV